MKINVIEEKRVTDNKTCKGCGYLSDERLYKCASFFCLLFRRCLPDTLEHCDDCKKARAGESIRVF